MAKPTKFGKKWRVRWINENGKQSSGGIYDTYREADVQLKLLEAKVEEIKLGMRSPTPIDRNFNLLCDYWLKSVLPQKRYQESDQSIIRKHLRPAFGHLPIRSIGRQQIDQYQAERTHLNKKTIANQTCRTQDRLRSDE